MKFSIQYVVGDVFLMYEQPVIVLSISQDYVLLIDCSFARRHKVFWYPQIALPYSSRRIDQ